MTQYLSEALSPTLENLDIAKAVMNACAEAKGKDIKALDVRGMFDLADTFVIVSGRSDRQVQGIANKILLTLAEHGVEPISVEGFEKAHWILLDFDGVVVHVFYEPAREHFDLESLWVKAKSIPVPWSEAARVAA